MFYSREIGVIIQPISIKIKSIFDSRRRLGPIHSAVKQQIDYSRKLKIKQMVKDASPCCFKSWDAVFAQQNKQIRLKSAPYNPRSIKGKIKVRVKCTLFFTILGLQLI